MLEYIFMNKYRQISTEHFTASPATTPTAPLFSWNYVTIFIAFLIAVFSAYLAHDCTKKSPSIVFRYLSIVLAFLFNTVYLLYYFIRYIILRDRC